MNNMSIYKSNLYVDDTQTIYRISEQFLHLSAEAHNFAVANSRRVGVTDPAKDHRYFLRENDQTTIALTLGEVRDDLSVPKGKMREITFVSLVSQQRFFFINGCISLSIANEKQARLSAPDTNLRLVYELPQGVVDIQKNSLEIFSVYGPEGIDGESQKEVLINAQQKAVQTLQTNPQIVDPAKAILQRMSPEELITRFGPDVFAILPGYNDTFLQFKKGFTSGYPGYPTIEAGGEYNTKAITRGVFNEEIRTLVIQGIRNMKTLEVLEMLTGAKAPAYIY